MIIMTFFFFSLIGIKEYCETKLDTKFDSLI